MTSLRVHRRGSADAATTPPVILLHAFPLDASMWAPVAERLELPTWAVDLPGFGGSPCQEQLSRERDLPLASSTEASARCVLEVLDAEGVDRAVVVGLSMGGYVAMALAELAPERVAAIGLLDTKAEPDDETARAGRLRMATAADGGNLRPALAMVEGLFAESTRAEHPELVADARGVVEGTDPACIAAAQRAMAMRPGRLAALEELGRRGVPALVVRGSEDAAASEESARAMAEALGTEVTTIDGAGHLTALEAPEEVAALVRDLAERAASAR